MLENKQEDFRTAHRNRGEKGAQLSIRQRPRGAGWGVPQLSGFSLSPPSRVPAERQPMGERCRAPAETGLRRPQTRGQGLVESLGLIST